MLQRIIERVNRNVENGRMMATSGRERGQTDTGGVVRLIVALTVGALVAAFLLPIAINELASAELNNASSGASALWNILDIMIVLAVFIFFAGIALSATDNV